MKTFDLITFGDMCVDLVITGADVVPQFGQVEKLVNDYTLEMGGSCCLFACQAARLGLRTAILGRVGADDFGRLILRRLTECGVNTDRVTIDPDLKTGLGVALCPPGDRAILTYMGTINAIRPEEVNDDLLSTARHLHHGSFYLHTQLRPAIPQIFQRARSLGLTTSLDPNWDPQENWDGGLMDALRWTDIFMPNDQEAIRTSRQDSLAQAAQVFQQQGARIVTIKAGEKGAWGYFVDGAWNQPVNPVSGGDSIGAGDSFDAGFLAGWLRGYPIPTCLQIASFCGRSVAGRIGGLAGQPAWAEVLAEIRPGG